MDTIGTVLKALLTMAFAANFIAWQHGVLGFDGNTIRVVNAMDVVVGLLAGHTAYRATFWAAHNVLFPIIDAILDRTYDRRGCECGKQHTA